MGGENDKIKVPNKKVKCLYTLYVCMYVCVPILTWFLIYLICRKKTEFSSFLWSSK